MSYDRRTGKRQATRRFAAPPKACPERFLTSGYGEALVSTPEPAVVIAWLRKQAG